MSVCLSNTYVLFAFCVSVWLSMTIICLSLCWLSTVVWYCITVTLIYECYIFIIYLNLTLLSIWWISKSYVYKLYKMSNTHWVNLTSNPQTMCPTCSTSSTPSNSKSLSPNSSAACWSGTSVACGTAEIGIFWGPGDGLYGDVDRTSISSSTSGTFRMPPRSTATRKEAWTIFY